MEIKISKPGNCQRVVEVDVSQEELTPYFDAVFKKYQKGIRLEGFRKGKVPLTLIKKIYGDEIRSEAIDDVVQNVFKEIREKENLRPLAPAKIEDLQYEPDKGLHFKAVVEVVPDLELKHYKDISVEQEIYEVGEDDVRAALEEIRENMAVMNPVEEAAQENHFVLADFQEISASGVPVIGNKFENRFFQLSNNDSTQELTEQLKGVKAGETRRVRITNFPSEAGRNEDIKYYDVNVKEIKEKQLPELNDELAKDFGNFETLEVLKTDLKAKLIKRHEANARHQLRRAIIDEIIKNNAVDIPESMVNNYLDIFIENVKQRNNGDIDEQELREAYRADAIWELKWHLLKEKIAEVENIEVNEKEDVLEEKVLDFLKQHAKIKKHRITRKDIEKAQKLAIP